jgi:hypothetical protein
MSTEETKKHPKATSSRKADANRRNAQLSTGPKTDEGKAKSSKNSITHGIFVTKLLDGATPETVTEIQELATSLREHYEPQGVLEEMLVQKIVIETARYGRIVALEHHPEPDRPLMYSLVCLDHTSRYSTATSRALYKAIEELERLQAARKAREGSASSSDGEVAPPSTEANKEEPEKQGAENALGDTSSLSEPEDALGKDEAA